MKVHPGLCTIRQGKKYAKYSAKLTHVWEEDVFTWLFQMCSVYTEACVRVREKKKMPAFGTSFLFLVFFYFTEESVSCIKGLETNRGSTCMNAVNLNIKI